MALREAAERAAAEADGATQTTPPDEPGDAVAVPTPVAPTPSVPSEPAVLQGTPLHITPYQHSVLLLALNPNRVGTKEGKSHLEAWDVRRTLTRIFGFGGWNVQTIELDKIYDHIAEPGEITRANGSTNSRPAYTVVYAAQVRLTIFNSDGTVGVFYEDGATGDGSNLPSYQAAADFAMKTALSQALKRCAVNLGDQFGLSLYNHGSLDAEVLMTLAGPEEVPGPDALAVTQTTPVRGEENGTTAAGPAPDETPDALPSAQELATEIMVPETSLDRLIQIHESLQDPANREVATTKVYNEKADQESLVHLAWRYGKQRKQAAQEAAQAVQDEDDARTRSAGADQ